MSPGDPSRHVVVVGAGISGLAAAYALQPYARVTVLEASDSVGGKIRLGEVGGVTVDVGAESMLARRPEAVTLATDVGLPIVHPATTKASIWTRGQLRPMPRSLMGVPVDQKELADSGILSRAGVVRAAGDQVLPATRLGESDVSVGWLIEERFGRELLDRLVEPLLGGVYAGHAREISALAAVPQIVKLLERDKSLSKAAAAALGPAPGTAGDPVPAAPVFAGIPGGLGRLPITIVEQLTAWGVEVRTGAAVRELARAHDEDGNERGWHLLIGPDLEVVDADAVLVAAPAEPAAQLLLGVAPDAALELARVETASMAVVTMAFPAHDFPAVRGSGFLVPPVDGRIIKAATYSFAKWDWVREAGTHAGGGDLLVMRASAGRHREESILQADDDVIVQRALEDLGTAIGLSVRPVDAHVQRWIGGLPQYAVGHLDRVARITSAVAKVPGLEVAGAWQHGLGIPACIASAQAAAARVLTHIGG